MEINDLISVVAVYRCQSFSGAALLLSYTTSAVSKHVRRVEEELGFSIFNRGEKSRSTTLTSEGQDVIPMIQEIVAKHAELMRLSATLSNGSEHATLRVGYPYLVGTFGEIDIMADYSARNPKINVLYTRGYGRDLIKQVADGVLDCTFLFVVGDFSPQDFCAKYNLLGMDFCLCNKLSGMYVGLSESDPLAKRDVISMTDFIHRPVAFWNNYSEPDEGNELSVDELFSSQRAMHSYLKYCEAHGVEPNVRFFNTMSHNVFQQAAASDLIIPVMRIGYTYANIRFVRVSDWENTGLLFFVTRQGNHSRALERLKTIVQSFAEDHLSDELQDPDY